MKTRAFWAKMSKNQHFFQINIMLVWVRWESIIIIGRCGERGVVKIGVKGS
ncbi:hypothetical protein ES703_119658 [subsurface metagenome]